MASYDWLRPVKTSPSQDWSLSWSLPKKAKDQTGPDFQTLLHASQSNTSSSKKQYTTMGAIMLNGIKESLDAFNSTLGCSLLLQPEQACADTSPEHQSKAMDLLQELESYLDNDHMVAFIDLFKADTAAADAYLAIKCDSL